jgi:hypothetical protein
LEEAETLLSVIVNRGETILIIIKAPQTDPDCEDFIVPIPTAREIARES